MYDPYRKVMTPDALTGLPQADLPEWLPMGDNDQGEQFTQASGTFADLLKKRMSMGKGAEGDAVGSATSGAKGTLDGAGKGMQSL